MVLQQLPPNNGGRVMRNVEHPLTGAHPPLSPSVAPISGIIEDGLFSDIDIAPGPSAFLPGHHVPMPSAAPLSDNDKLISGDLQGKESALTEGATDSGSRETERVVVVVAPQPMPSNNDSASFSFPPFTIVGPAGFILIVVAIFFWWWLTSKRGQ